MANFISYLYQFQSPEESYDYFFSITKSGIAFMHTIIKTTMTLFVIYSAYKIFIHNLGATAIIVRICIYAILLVLNKINTKFEAFITKNPGDYGRQVSYLLVIVLFHFMLNQMFLLLAMKDCINGDIYRGMLLSFYIISSIFGAASVFKSFKLILFLQIVNTIIIIICSVVDPTIYQSLPFFIFTPVFLMTSMLFIDRNSRQLFLKEKQIAVEHTKFKLCLDNSSNAIALLTSTPDNDSILLNMVYINPQWRKAPFCLSNDAHLLTLLSTHCVKDVGTIKDSIQSLLNEDTSESIVKGNYNIELYYLDKLYYFKVEISIIKHVANTSLIFLQYIDNTASIELSEQKLKSKMICSLSHELLTPMNSIISIAEKLINSNPQSFDSHSLSINSSLLFLKIKDYICYSEYMKNELFLRKSYVNLQELNSNLFSIYEDEAKAKGIKLHTNYSQNLPFSMFCDKTRIMQVISNILSNAIKYTKQNGKITISYQYEAHILKITIEDTGVGFDLKNLEDGKFAGLGITISKYICEKMGSNLQIKSTIGKGSTFTFTISNHQATIEEEDIPFERYRIERLGLVRGSDLFSHQKSQSCYIIVDDNYFNRMTIKMMLGKWKNDISLYDATNGVEAVKLVKDLAPLFESIYIFMDVDMPIMDGIKATRILLEWGSLCSYNCKLTIIGVTAFSQEEDLRKCREAGMKYAFTKPISQSQIQQCLEAE